MAPLLALMLLSQEPSISRQCELIRPVAPDEAAARRIAEAVIATVPSSPLVRQSMRAGRPYRLEIQPDPEDAGKWIAFQSPPPSRRRLRRGEIEVQFAGHGLAFRIDRCTGAISRMHYSR